MATTSKGPSGTRDRVLVELRRRIWAIRQRWLMRRLAGRRVLRAFAAAYREAVFLEIGANDGAQGDHLRPYVRDRAWRGVLVEPHPEAFARLRRNLARNPDLAFENVAVSDHDGTLELYEVRPAGPGQDSAHIGSLDLLTSASRESLDAHGWITEDRLSSFRVPCVSLATLAARHHLADLDLMLVDTEGHEEEILLQLEDSTLSPRLIVFEHCLLPADARARIHTLLRSRGYELMEEGFDTWCLDARPDDSVSRTWRGLRPRMPPLYLRDAP